MSITELGTTQRNSFLLHLEVESAPTLGDATQTGKSTVNSQQSTVNSQQSTVNSK
ncbi:hypothetical protein [Nostoc favosum]|uniref:hypothetical protein n=1 Tax=Nostoc favosum TaxID=2907819 RepID=UPI001E2B0DF6|nr:hypothetical protein [Nostoc favosum]